MKKKKRIKITLVIPLAVLIIFLISYFILFPPFKRFSAKKPEKVLLIIIDTLRADHLGCYGYKNAETRTIDKLAKSGILFLQAISPIPETGPAVSSMLTSLYPRNHGTRRNTQYLVDNVVTLAEILKEKGFKTAAFTDTFPFANLNILQGFDLTRRRLYPELPKNNLAKKLLKEPIKWFRENSRENTFTLLHFYEPHAPYTPPVKSKRTKSLNYQGIFTGEIGPILGLWEGEFSINQADIEHITSLYDDEISFVDRCLNIVFRELKRTRAYEKTLIILTADHGESLGEHDYYFDHGDYLYEDQIRVPLIIRYSGMPKKRSLIKTQVRTIDIMPTVLELLNIEYNGPQDGISLLPLIKGKKKLPGTKYAFSESDAIDFSNLNCKGYIKGIQGKHLSVRHNELKLIYIPHPQEAKLELYNLDKDPLELSNIYEKKVKAGENLKKVLFNWLSKEKKPAKSQKKLDEETIKILKSLHYIHD